MQPLWNCSTADGAVHDPAASVDAQVETTGRGIWITKDVSELRIDYVSAESPLLGVWRGKRLKGQQGMKNIKFVAKVHRRGARGLQYVQRVDPTPIQMTTNRKLALLMGRFTAEGAVQSLQDSHCISELESVQVSV